MIRQMLYSRYSPYFWIDYYWNRIFCLLGRHIVIPYPREFAKSADEVGKPVCLICQKSFPFDRGYDYIVCDKNGDRW